MAQFIARIVEPVIEDPVIDILAVPVQESSGGGLLPRFNLGPLGIFGRPHPRNTEVPLEEKFSIGSDKGEHATGPGPEIQPDYLSFPLNSGSTDATNSGWVGLASSRPPGSSSDQFSSLNSATQNSEDTEEDLVDHNEESQPDTVPDTTIFTTPGDDIIDVQFVFPDDIQTEPVTHLGTTQRGNVLIGNGGDDTISGDGGDDILIGWVGNDALNGGGGNDFLIGGADNDELTGGDGSDQLIGGHGADRFVFNNAAESPVQTPDLVFDFNAAQGDKIDVSGIDAISGTIDNDEFIFVGDNAFSGNAGELHLNQNLANDLLEGDVNGDGTADFTIELLGVSSLSGDDIMGLV